MKTFYLDFLLLFPGLPAPLATTLTSYDNTPSEERQGE